MENKKQTVVEWLYEMLRDSSKEVFDGNIWEQAKQMEKQQIIKSNRDGVDMVVNKQPFITGEEYYKETYEKNNN